MSSINTAEASSNSAPVIHRDALTKKLSALRQPSVFRIGAVCDVLRRHVPQPALHLRLDIALCRLYQRDGRHEAVIGQDDLRDVVSMTQIADPINARILPLHSVHYSDRRRTD